MDYSGINYDYNDNVYLVTNMMPEATGKVLARIDVGATSNYTDALGRLLVSDAGLFTPSTAPIEGNDSTAIDDTLDDPIYRTLYRGNVGNVPQDQRVISFALPMGAATRVDVRLHVAERFWTSAGKRLEDIYAEGNLLVDGFDIWATAGAVNRAWVVELDDVAVNDGTLNLAFKASVDFRASPVSRSSAARAVDLLEIGAHGGRSSGAGRRRRRALAGRRDPAMLEEARPEGWEHLVGGVWTLPPSTLCRSHAHSQSDVRPT